eukprot:TRINITY_DN91395_c0_g1_i1.p1 TRINITY_DN91395_c0_g1~~TRINITY_DN91395_c0_g1_i1.p1  ORF type:complete len:623 (-),score=79.22 TRINITY_DN91395_c0_g1_i1:176-1933(-)
MAMMRLPEVIEDVLQVCAALSLLLYLIVVIMRCFRGGRQKKLGDDTSCWAALRQRIEQLLKPPHKDSSKKSSEEVLALQYFRDWEQGGIRTAMLVMGPVFFIATVQVLAQWMTGSLSRGFASSTFFGVIPALWLATACLWRDPGVTLRGVFQCCTFLSILSGTLQYVSAADMILDRIDVFIWRLAIAFVGVNRHFSAAMNVTYSVCAVVCFVALVGEASEPIFEGNAPQNFITGEAGQLAMLLALPYGFSMQSLKFSEATVAAHVAKSLKSAVQMLLENMCDVVLELDEHLNIANGAELLSGVLLTGAPGAVQGSSFASMMASEADFRIFQDHLRHSADSALQSVRTHCSIHMRDSMGIGLHVKLHHSRFRDAHGSLRYLVGITEVDAEMATVPEDSTSLDGRVKKVPYVNRGTPATLPETILSSCEEPENNLDIPHTPARRLKLSHPEFEKETEIMARLISMNRLLDIWNIQLLASDCCALHGKVREAKSVLALLKKLPCSSQAHYTHQCLRCGLLVNDDEIEDQNGSEDVTHSILECSHCSGLSCFDDPLSHLQTRASSISTQKPGHVTSSQRSVDQISMVSL